LTAQEVFMKRLSLTALVVAALIVSFFAGVRAAAKSYQFTGVVKAADASSMTVEKSAKETWIFETGKDTKGTAKVGDRVTVYYKMVATEIEAKSATAAATKKK
jgi:hypothetical protein